MVSCHPDGMDNPCLTNPSGSSNAFTCKLSNIGEFAAQLFAKRSKDIAEALEASTGEKIRKLEQAAEHLTKMARIPYRFERYVRFCEIAKLDQYMP